jgi:hypothetical protein
MLLEDVLGHAAAAAQNYRLLIIKKVHKITRANTVGMFSIPSFCEILKFSSQFGY